MGKILIPASGPEDWRQFLAEPDKQLRLLRMTSGFSLSVLRALCPLPWKARCPNLLGQP